MTATKEVTTTDCNASHVRASRPLFQGRSSLRLAKRSTVAALCAVPAFAGLSCVFAATEQNKSNGDNRSVANRPAAVSEIHAQGKLVPAGGITRLAGLPGDRVDAILVKAGEKVTADQPLIVMKSEFLKKLEIEAAESKLSEARSMQETRLRELRLNVRAADLRNIAAEQSIAMAREQVASAKKTVEQVERLRSQLAKLQQLREDPLTRAAVGALEIETRQLEVDKSALTAQQALLTATQALQQSELQAKQSKETWSAAQETLRDAEAISPTASLEKQLEILKLQLTESTLRAPYAGTVLNVPAAVGDRVATLPLLELADLGSMVCIAEVYETDVPNIRIGDEARLRSKSLVPEEIVGRVSRIDRVVGASQLRSPNPMARADFRAIGVWIEIPKEHAETAGQRVQLQVDVTIFPKR